MTCQDTASDLHLLHTLSWKLEHGELTPYEAHAELADFYRRHGIEPSYKAHRALDETARLARRHRAIERGVPESEAAACTSCYRQDAELYPRGPEPYVTSVCGHCRHRYNLCEVRPAGCDCPAWRASFEREAVPA